MGKFMKKTPLILLILSIFCHNSVFAQEFDDYASSIAKSDNGFAVGANFDPYFLAPGIKAGYKINSYLGIHGLAQYTSSDDASSIPAEKLSRDKIDASLLSGFSYKNMFASLVLDAYPLENNLKLSAGIGYIDRTLTTKKLKKEFTNKNKLVALASVGYEGRFLAGQNFGYDIELGMKFLDMSVENEQIAKIIETKANWKVIPAINIALTYSF